MRDFAVAKPLGISFSQTRCRSRVCKVFLLKTGFSARPGKKMRKVMILSWQGSVKEKSRARRVLDQTNAVGRHGRGGDESLPSRGTK